SVPATARARPSGRAKMAESRQRPRAQRLGPPARSKERQAARHFEIIATLEALGRALWASFHRSCAVRAPACYSAPRQPRLHRVTIPRAARRADPASAESGPPAPRVALPWDLAAIGDSQQ